jgi:hypothetical protein
MHVMTSREGRRCGVRCKDNSGEGRVKGAGLCDRVDAM